MFSLNIREKTISILIYRLTKANFFNQPLRKDQTELTAKWIAFYFVVDALDFANSVHVNYQLPNLQRSLFYLICKTCT